GTHWFARVSVNGRFVATTPTSYAFGEPATLGRAPGLTPFPGRVSQAAATAPLCRRLARRAGLAA
ncbi:MAG TPA: hypothetical protein VGI54_12535, partial [Solirubrobacteraceae bacterium]